MRYKSSIKIESENAKIIHDAIRPELEKQVSKRSNVTIKVAGNELRINSEAKDANALRACNNNVLRLVHASEKVSEKKWQ